MSADNWAVCPRCLYEAKKRKAAAVEAAAALYGKVPAEEFDERRQAADAVDVDPEHFRTFREDYEQGVSDPTGADPDRAEYFVSYGGACSVCGLEHEFKHETEFWKPES